MQQFKYDVIMPVIYFSKRERIKKMNRIRQWMRWKGKKQQNQRILSLCHPILSMVIMRRITWQRRTELNMNTFSELKYNQDVFLMPGTHLQIAFCWVSSTDSMVVSLDHIDGNQVCFLVAKREVIWKHLRIPGQGSSNLTLVFRTHVAFCVSLYLRL